MNAELELHAAILNKLGSSIPNIFGTDAPVLDNVDQDQKAPYVTVGDALFNDFSADVTTGFNALFTINVWSDYLGQAECKYLQGQVYELLNRSSLTMTNYNVLGCDFVSNNGVLLDPNGITRHGIQQFRVFITKTQDVPPSITRYFRRNEGTTDYISHAPVTVDRIVMTVSPSAGNGNTGLPTGAPAVTDNVLQTIDFAYSGTISELCKNGLDNFSGIMANVKYYFGGVKIHEYDIKSGTDNIPDTIGSNDATVINPSEGYWMQYVQESKFTLRGDNYWTFGDVLGDGTSSAYDVLAGSISQGVTNGDQLLRLDWDSNTLSGNGRFIAGVATYNVQVGQSPDLNEYVDAGGNERLYFQGIDAAITGSMKGIRVNPIIKVLDTRTEYTVIHLGDSITNTMLTDSITEYQELYDSVSNLNVKAVNEGVGGDTIQDMHVRLPAILASYSGISNVLFVVMAGANQELTLPDFGSSLNAVVSDIKAAGHSVAVANKTASNNDDISGIEPDVNTSYNNLICQNSTSDWFLNGRPVCDLYTLTSGHHSAPEWFYDNVHPNDLGSYEMRNYFASKIAPLLVTNVP